MRARTVAQAHCVYFYYGGVGGVNLQLYVVCLQRFMPFLELTRFVGNQFLQQLGGVWTSFGVECGRTNRLWVNY